MKKSIWRLLVQEQPFADVFQKKVFLKFWQYLQENTCAGALDKIKSNKRGMGSRNKQGELGVVGVGNYDKIKRKGLFINKIQFYH